MKINIILLILSSLIINAKDYILLNDRININICDKYPANKTYNWKFDKKPLSSAITNDEINQNNCSISFTPDVEGIYLIKFNTENIEEYFEYEVLNSLEKSSIDISYIINNQYYYDNLEYYKYSENNKLIFNIKNTFKKINFNIKGTAFIKDLTSKEEYIINTKHPYYFKYDHLYNIILYPDKYYEKEFTINTKSFDITSINLIKKTNKLNFALTDFENKKIIGIVTIYNNEIKVSKFNNSDIFTDEANKLLFTPIKSINNYPSILYFGDLNSTIELKYDDIIFSNLYIKLDSLPDDTFIKVKIKSLFLDKCLLNSLNTICNYQKTIILNKNKDISLPNGRYQITESRKGFYDIIKTIDLDNDSEFLIDNLLEVPKVNVEFPENTKAISFSDIKGNNYFFNIDKTIKKIKIPEGLYDITIFTHDDLYNIKLIEINDDIKINYNRRKLNIEIKENSKNKYGGIIIIENKNYIFNNDEVQEFYIEK